MNRIKLPAKSWEYILNLEEENDYVVSFELWNTEAHIRNIDRNPHAESPVYKKIIIPHLKELHKKLETLGKKINYELETDGDKTIDDLVSEEN